MVFAKLLSGNTLKSRLDSLLNVYLQDPNGRNQDERGLFYRTFNQVAWSYNSENMVLPINISSTAIKAVLDGTFPPQNFAAAVKIQINILSLAKISDNLLLTNYKLMDVNHEISI